MIEQDPTHPTGVSADENGERKDAIRARERKANAAIQMKAAGAEWSEIAEVLGYPTGRHALVAVENALERELNETDKTFLRSLTSKRLERLIRSVWPKALDETSPEQMVAVGRARELIADHRKLFGLDAPTEVSVHTPDSAEIQSWVAKVAAIGAPKLEEDNIFDVDSDESETVFEPEESGV